MNIKFTLEPLQLIGWFVVVLGSNAWIPGTSNEININSLSSDIEFDSASMFRVVVLPPRKSILVKSES